MADNVRVIQPVEMLAGTRVADFKEEVEIAVKDSAKIILVDLRDIKFIDSSGLGALVSTLKKVEAAGKELYCCSISNEAKITLEISDMEQLFSWFKNREEFEQTVLAGT